MAGLKSGLTERTIESLQLNAGVLLSSYTKGGDIKEENIIGATRGGGTISITPTLRQVAIDGAPTYTKGLERIDDVVVQLSFTMVEFTKELITMAIPGSSALTTTDTLIQSTKSVLASADYKDIYWVGDTSNGKNVVIKLKNSLSTGGLSITTTDKGEGTFALTLTAHYDPKSLVSPYDITIES